VERGKGIIFEEEERGEEKKGERKGKSWALERHFCLAFFFPKKKDDECHNYYPGAWSSITVSNPVSVPVAQRLFYHYLPTLPAIVWVITDQGTITGTLKNTIPPSPGCHLFPK
jgi:hypothetical protein